MDAQTSNLKLRGAVKITCLYDQDLIKASALVNAL